MILADGGGSNSSRHYIFKYDPIEHCMFCHVTRACKGVVFESIEIVAELMKKTKTKQGLKVLVNIKDKIYMTGRKVSSDFKNNMKIVFDEHLKQWNYVVISLYKRGLFVVLFFRNYKP